MSHENHATGREGHPGSDRRLRAFRSTDAFVIEAYRSAATIDRKEGSELARAVRRCVTRCGGALVAASVSPSDGRYLVEALTGLAEARYYLYLARRFGLLDLRRYRSLTCRQDVAYRELESALRGAAPAAPRARSPGAKAERA